MTATPSAPPRGPWLEVLGAVVLTLATLVAVAVPLVQASAGSAEVARVEGMVGRTEVLDGRLVRVDGGLMLPVTSGLYEVQVPSSAPVPEAGGPAQVKTAMQAGFQDEEDFPREVQVLVVYEERTTPDGLSLGAVHAVDHALPGETLVPVGASDVRAAEDAVADRVRSAVVAGAVGTLLVVALVVLAVRRSRRRRSWRAAAPVPAGSW